jgi:RNA polymerase sigma-70 factor, ECF subfamily
MAEPMSCDDLATPSICRTLNGRAARMTRYSRADADDLVQDTFERALRNLHRFEPGTNLQAWLVTIMSRLLIDRTRAKPKLASVDVDSLPASGDYSPDNDNEVATIATTAQLDQAISRLPKPFRHVLELREREGLSYGQIARRLSLPVSTVGTRLIRARRQLRAQLTS